MQDGNSKWVLQYVNASFQMYAPLFNAQMCVDGGVACCASQVFVFSVGDVLSSAVVSVLLRQTKVNKEQLVTEKDKKGKRLIEKTRDNFHFLLGQIFYG